MLESTQPDGTAAPRLRDGLRQTLRVRHGRLRTEQQYVNWVRRFCAFNLIGTLARWGLRRSAPSARKINPATWRNAIHLSEYAWFSRCRT